MRELPKEFLESIKPVVGDDIKHFTDALSDEPSVSIRVNDAKSDIPVMTQVPWCEYGFYLSERPPFTFDPMLHAGAYYVQEASSMFVWQALKQYAEPHWIILDMCAAPGGKSTLINQYLRNGGFLVCNEFVPQRANILAENIAKWGRPNTLVTNNAPSHFEKYSETFDAILVDAPCSGEGMFRKDENAINEWSLHNVDICVNRQRDILASAWKALKDGGLLIYSTCTFNTKENEENVRWLMSEYGAEELKIDVNEEWNITQTECGYRFLPHKTRGEGLFLAVVRKPGEYNAEERKFRIPKKLPEKNDALLKWLHTEHYTTLLYKDVYYAISKERYAMVLSMINDLNVLQFGVPLAQPKGKDMIPQQQLALSSILNREQFNVCELTYDEAISYLKAESMVLTEAPKGFVLVTYKNLPLGFVKNIGNRCNNLYPSHWRIRSNAVMEEFSVL